MGPTRKELRISAVIPIRISTVNQDGEAANCLAHTLNVSRRGARIAGVTVALRVGTVVRITRGRAIAKFRVNWVGKKDAKEKGQDQIGVECLEMIGNFWGLEQLEPVSADEERERSQRRITK
jgi:hypothetical protein